MGFARIERSSSSRYDRVGDTTSRAWTVQVGHTYEARIQSPWTWAGRGRRRRRTIDIDNDKFKLEVEAGKTYTIDINPTYLTQGHFSISGSKGVINLDDDKGLAMVALRKRQRQTLTFTAEDNDTLYLGIRGNGLTSGTYQLKINDTTPAPDPDVPLKRRETIAGSNPAPTVDRAQISSDTTLITDTALVDSYEGYQPSLHGVRGATVNLEGDITLSSDIQVKSHGPQYAFNTEGVGQTGGRGGYGGGCPAWGIRAVTLNGDDGSQTIRMHSQTTSITDGLVRAYGFDSSTVDLGNGTNTIDLSVKVTSGTDYTWRRWLPNYSVPGTDTNSSTYGDIQPTTYQRVWGYGQAYGYGMIGSTVTTGEDADSININVNADNDSQGAPWEDARTNYSADSFGLHTTRLATGAGDDNISISALSQGATTFRKGSWQAASGGLWIDGTLQTHTYDDIGVYKSTIELGDGNDQLTVTTAQQRSDGKHTHYAGTALDEATINLGAGDDTFTLTGKIKNSTINGGEGYDILDLESNFLPGRSWKVGSQSGFNNFKRALAENQLTTESQLYLPQLSGLWSDNDVLISGFEAIKIGGEILEIKPPLINAESIFSVDDVVVNGGDRVSPAITRTGGTASSGKLYFEIIFQRPDGEYSHGETYTTFKPGQTTTASISFGSTNDTSHPEYYSSAELKLIRAEFDGPVSFGDAIGEVSVI